VGETSLTTTCNLLDRPLFSLRASSSSQPFSTHVSPDPFDFFSAARAGNAQEEEERGRRVSRSENLLSGIQRILTNWRPSLIDFICCRIRKKVLEKGEAANVLLAMLDLSEGSSSPFPSLAEHPSKGDFRRRGGEKSLFRLPPPTIWSESDVWASERRRSAHFRRKKKPKATIDMRWLCDSD